MNRGHHPQSHQIAESDRRWQSSSEGSSALDVFSHRIEDRCCYRRSGSAAVVGLPSQCASYTHNGIVVGPVEYGRLLCVRHSANVAAFVPPDGRRILLPMLARGRN